MNISKSTLNFIDPAIVIIPDAGVFDLPEKVLQFGTGVLLRGLPDFFIDKANRNGTFNGRIVVVKSTGKGDVTEFEQQDNLYTICIRGVVNGGSVEENILSSSISRVIAADQDWNAILEVARQRDLKVIVSNTTEIGIQLVEESINQDPPVSFPAKLLAVLYARYQALGDHPDADMVVIATELIPDNGTKLCAIVAQLIEFNQLEVDFTDWMNARIIFCNSLVDRIVPGKPDAEARLKLEQQLGYSDELLIMAEPYALWAIEGAEKVSALLNLEQADAGILVKPDIEIYRELKLRLLNGSHTLASGIAFLSGIDTVSKAMDVPAVKDYIRQVMFDEIIPAIPYRVDDAEAATFAKVVLDRFANPYIAHPWINITFQYTMKVKIRILPVLSRYYEVYERAPRMIAFGFAAYLQFMKCSKKEGANYFGNFGGTEYQITDDQAGYFYSMRALDADAYVKTVLSDQEFWETNLLILNGFITLVEEYYDYISSRGIQEALASVN
ncbi:tagaturonate reductase [Pedobacter metabolipauper]|uniref:Tagaturonate reductase n=1 Tax=Pedobacter metabolipauper TaxID=425513 RepID=A0A4R6SYF7_9SPHI|nr:tagaturonate reductase [Pedobacter metabolipauper]TDQ11604.1 tagaturonate reductase [Pedobacter metabolipauper]